MQLPTFLHNQPLDFWKFQQFFRNDFQQTHIPTVHKNVYKNCLVCETHVRELIVFDVPLQVCQQRSPNLSTYHGNNTAVIHLVCSSSFQRRFPVDNLAEWNNGHPLGLRSVQAYVLVFDMANPETFLVCTKHRSILQWNGESVTVFLDHFRSSSASRFSVQVLPDDARPNPGKLLAPWLQYNGNWE